MKKLLIALAFLGCQQISFGQDVEKHENVVEGENNDVHNIAGIDTRPDFPGGINEFYSYIAKSYRVPDVKGLKGKVYVKFVVEKDGSITDIKVIKDIGYGTGDEAVRILKECPNWIPGEQNGRKVRVLFTLPISIEAQ